MTTPTEIDGSILPNALPPDRHVLVRGGEHGTRPSPPPSVRYSLLRFSVYDINRRNCPSQLPPFDMSLKRLDQPARFDCPVRHAKGRNDVRTFVLCPCGEWSVSQGKRPRSTSAQEHGSKRPKASGGRRTCSAWCSRITPAFSLADLRNQLPNGMGGNGGACLGFVQA